MPNMPFELCRALRRARVDRCMTQSQLAAEVGCQQSAISMLERGQTRALSREAIQAIAERLELDLAAFSLDWAAEPVGQTLRYCPLYDCPSNLPYAVRGELLFLPSVALFAGQGGHCPYCGELLETNCPNAECGLPVQSGGCCGACGTAYVPAPEQIKGDSAAKWAEEQRRWIGELGLGAARIREP